MLFWVGSGWEEEKERRVGEDCLGPASRCGAADGGSESPVATTEGGDLEGRNRAWPNKGTEKASHEVEWKCYPAVTKASVRLAGRAPRELSRRS